VLARVLGYAPHHRLAWWATRSFPQGSFRQLTSAQTAELYSTLSPDGRWIVYSGEGTGNRDLYLQSTSGDTPINLTKDSPDDDEQPAWSPDGKLLAYTTVGMELRPQNSAGRSEIWVVAVDAGAPPRKVFDGDATMPSWSPGGMRIAFNQSLSIDRHVGVLTIPSSGGEPVLVEGDQAEIAWNPVWAPDGRYIYFISNHGGSPNIWRKAIDETTGATRGEAEPITTPAAAVAHLSVSSDGKHISYSAVSEAQHIQRVPLIL
jgi:Tol biopolymer transport system component